MFTKKTNFKVMKADTIISAFKKNILLFWILHLVDLLAIFGIIAAFILHKMSVINLIFSGMTLCLAQYLIYAGRKIQLHKLNNILSIDCDAVKSEKVFSGVMHVRGVDTEICELHIARAQYYAGKFKEALDTLHNMKRPSEKSAQIFLFYNIMAGCYEELGEFERVIEVREKIKLIMSTLKDGSANLRTGQQLLTIIDGILTFHQGSYQRCYDIYEGLFDATSFPLSRMTVLIKLAKMDQVTGAARSAIDHCEYVLEACGTTFYRKQANDIMKLCKPAKKKSGNVKEQIPAEVSEEEKQDAAE